MKEQKIDQSIQKMKIHLAQSDQIEHWVNFLFFLFPLSLIGYTFIESFIQNKGFPFSFLVLFVIIFLLLRHKLISPKMSVYATYLTEKEFKEANQAAATLNDWEILSNTKVYFSAIRKTNWQWDGIRITAILKDGNLYLNSMVNPSIRSNPFTFGLNSKNKFELIRQYQSVLKGNDVIGIANHEVTKREEAFWNESEWTLEGTIKRILGYGLSIPFIILALWMIFEGTAQSFYGILIWGLCISYIYYDIKIIREKKKRRKAG